jgi:hypothetical protein
MKYLAFVGPSYTSQSPNADCERLVNQYVERVEAPGGKDQWQLLPTPGFSVYATPGVAGAGRGLYHINGRSFAVVGSNLYEIDILGVMTLRGSGLNNLDGSPARFCSNGDGGHQVGITSCSKFYVYDLNANTLTFTLDGPTQCGFVDGFAIVLDPATSTLKFSAPENFASFDPLDVAQRNDAPDKWAAMIVSHKEIWLLGSQSTSVYYNSGASDPFVPNPSVFINHGIGAPNSLAIFDNAPAWLGQNGDGAYMVYRANGYTPERISTHAVEYAISQYSTVADAQAWTYQEGGHSFYLLTFPTAGATWGYDIASGTWHERGAWNGSTFTTLPVYGHCFAWGLHLTMDATTGTVYRMSTGIYSDGGGRVLRRVRRAPHISNEGKRVTYDKLELDFEAGLGLSSGTGSDPQIDLRWSDDGGKTWSNTRSVSAGRLGEYKARAIWRRLGSARDRVFEVAFSEPIPLRMLNAYLEIRPGVN